MLISKAETEINDVKLYVGTLDLFVREIENELEYLPIYDIIFLLFNL
jgi:hypothetical protein